MICMQVKHGFLARRLDQMAHACVDPAVRRPCRTVEECDCGVLHARADAATARLCGSAGWVDFGGEHAGDKRCLDNGGVKGKLWG
uniref:Uncharacterized protein n=1 Tax=Oryza nivara TaxID=4536 RepID=A0A0E0GXT0_ORYNI